MTVSADERHKLWMALTRGTDPEVLAAVEQLKGIQPHGLVGAVEAVARHMADAANGRHEGSRQCELLSQALIALGQPSAIAIVEFMFLRLLKSSESGTQFFYSTGDIGHHSSTAGWPVIRQIWWLYDKLHWTPGTDETTARYWCARCMFENCIPMGKPAIPPLAEVLRNGYSDFPSSAGYTLASLKNVDDASLRDQLAALGCGEALKWVLHARHLTMRNTRHHNAVIQALMPSEGKGRLDICVQEVQEALRKAAVKHPIPEDEHLSSEQYVLLARSAYSEEHKLR